MTTAAGPEGPLEGVTVLDCTVTIPGPYATALLHRLGARVIKVEPPGGDITRMFPDVHDALNVGKQSVVADLKNPDDVELVRTIARRANVFVEGWRPGVAERLGLGPDQIRAQNPPIVYCSISGYGADGTMRDRPGHDLNYVAASGAARMMFGDDSPKPLGLPIADLAGGTFAALRINAALVEARTTGRGSFIDASLGGAIRDWVEAMGGERTEQPLGIAGNLPHYGVFETADGHHLTLGVMNEDHFWLELCRALDLAAWEGLTFMDRAKSAKVLRGKVEQAIRTRTRAELEDALAHADTCWAFADSPLGKAPIGGMIPPASGRVAAPGEDAHVVRIEFLRVSKPPKASAE